MTNLTDKERDTIYRLFMKGDSIAALAAALHIEASEIEAVIRSRGRAR